MQHTAETLMSLADNMAAAAATFSSHGYDRFIQTRDELKIALEKLAENIKDMKLQ